MKTKSPAARPSVPAMKSSTRATATTPSKRRTTAAPPAPPPSPPPPRAAVIQITDGDPLKPLLQALLLVRSGEFNVRLEAHTNGTLADVVAAFNEVVGLNRRISSEFTRVSTVVGQEGVMTERADSAGLSGGWRTKVEAANSLIQNLAQPTAEAGRVITAVAQGDLSQKMALEIGGRPLRGEFLRIGNIVNTMVGQLGGFSSEVTRVAREVGTEGKLGGQAQVPGVAGTWKDLTDNVNTMASSLTSQVRNIAEVTIAVANGDLSKKITVEAKGEILQLKDTINQMVDRLNAFSSEVTRVAKEVGTDGKLGGQAEVKGVSGTWKDLTENVNRMASNLTDQVRNIALVTTAVANGDLSQQVTVEVSGEMLDLKRTINQMVDRLNSFSAEVTRVAREVGTDGKLGGQADVKGVSGTWKDLTDNVNTMAGSLTSQVRNIAKVTTAVANGDLTQKITVEAKGEILQLKDTVNQMVDRLNAFSAEVTRVAREVGTDGKLGGQADVKGVSGTWKDLTDNVNTMAGSLTSQVRNIADVTIAVANGDLSQKITVEAKGEILELKDTINRMVDQLNGFSAEVTRVAKEVGADGKLGGQADVKGVSGTWKDLTDNVNGMATSLTSQVRDIAKVTTAVANGDLSQKITVDARGEILELKDTINRMVDQLNGFSAEVTRVAREVGTEGKLGGQGFVRGVSGTWKDLTDSVNRMAANLTDQVRNIAVVTTAVANGDLSQQITVEARGEILELKNTINRMVNQLNSFAGEVTRVAKEVGTEGKLGGQAEVLNVSGTWKGLTDSVNRMATNLTDQVRNIAVVTTAVANGDLTQKITVEAKGEILQLKDTINRMVDRLNSFAAEVTRVAREVGTEGRLGGQAEVRDVSGTWADLTSNVNQLAGNLTTQVRAIAEVATAVSKGDLSRTVTVQAKGEVSDLKDNVNRMIGALKDTTNRNQEQDWLKTNLAKFTRVLQGQRDLQAVCKLTLSELAPLIGAQHGVFYINESQHDAPYLKLLASYAFRERKQVSNQFKPGEGLIGQCLLEKERIVITDAPEDYVRISSGLGEGRPNNLVVLPVIFEGKVLAVIEIASFNRFTDIQLTFLDQLAEGIGIVINTIAATMRTEELLKQSQSLTEELQNQQGELTDKNKRLEEQAKSLQASEELLKQQQEELQQTNEELKEKAKLLGEQKAEVERKNDEVEQARGELVVKAEQLALTSKYKSEFLANMSHELRTPLNSLLILSGILSDNADGNLTPKQVEYARTIKGSGGDLLELINEILDLAKIESGTMSVEVAELAFAETSDFVSRTFGHVAEQKKLGFAVEVDPALPRVIRTDVRRVQQILKNLLSNAFKFTETGSVTVTMAAATHGWSSDHPRLHAARLVVGFTVTDTGIGIPKDKQALIFEAFQQAEGGTARKYGGTGLGLSISREIAKMLGGTVRVVSEPGKGSAFTLYLPENYTPPTAGGGGGGDGGNRGPVAGPAPMLFGGPGPITWSAPPASGEPPAPPTRPTEPPAPSRLPKAQADDAGSAPASSAANRADAAPLTDFDDDRHHLAAGDQVLLVVEDDRLFAGLLADLAREKGFKCVVALTAERAGQFVRQYSPVAITLDLRLPDGDGWAVLDRFKHDPATAHIPVHIISVEEQAERGLRLGAIGYLTKPVTKEAVEAALEKTKEFINCQVKHLLLVDDDEKERLAIAELVGNGDVQITGVASAEDALAALEKQHFDCAVMDLKLPGMSGFELIRRVKKTPAGALLPIIVYTGKELARMEEAELRKLSEAIVIKDVKSPERLLDETALFLHRIRAKLPEAKRKMLERAQGDDPLLANRKVLVVDDDMRNIFALTTALERWKMKVVNAESGQQALDVLAKTPDMDLVLMDVMMPEMDGWECMRRIRAQAKFKKLPILAVTAKAKKGDREKCLEAGASDYVTKPVDIEQLRSLMRVWLYR